MRIALSHLAKRLKNVSRSDIGQATDGLELLLNARARSSSCRWKAAPAMSFGVMSETTQRHVMVPYHRLGRKSKLGCESKEAAMRLVTFVSTAVQGLARGRASCAAARWWTPPAYCAPHT